MSSISVKNLPLQGSEFFEGRCNTHIKVAKFNYTWTIKNFNLSPVGKHAKGVIQSPTFPDGPENKIKWRLTFYPAGYDYQYGNTISWALFLVSCDDSELKAKITLKLLDLNDKTISVLCDEHRVFKQGHGHMFCNISQNQMLNEQLILSCEIFVGVEVVNISQKSPITTTQQCNLSDDYRVVFENQEFSDVTLIAGEKEFKVHKVILGARSPVFNAMFLHQMQESMQNRVEIVDVDPEVLNELLRFIYTGQVHNLNNIAIGLLSAADKYGLERLKVMCEEALCENISIENAADILMLADLHNTGKLKLQTKKYIAANAKKITETSGWKTMYQTYPHLVTEFFCDVSALRNSELTEN